MAEKTAPSTPPGEVAGAKLTFTISAIIEGFYFGLAFLLFAGFFMNMLSAVEATPTELYFLRIVAVLALALGIGCWYARNGNQGEVRLMSLLMFIAKGGSTIILVAMMFAVETVQPIGWINPILTAIIALLNIRQYLLTE